MRKPLFTSINLIISVALTACGSDTESSASTITLSLLPQTQGVAAQSAALDLWSQITIQEDFRTWPLLPGTTAQQPGMMPHGAFVSLYYSGGDAQAPSAGMTVVKDNFDAQGNLAATTVMSKQPGFDPANGDWFYARYNPDGTVFVNEGGVMFAGAVEPAPGAGCIGCHRGATGSDYLFSN